LVATISASGACHAAADTSSVRFPTFPPVMWRRTIGAAKPATAAAAAHARSARERRKNLG
jgi:hypothetical protein